MKQKVSRRNRKSDRDTMRPEYDFSHGVRGKYYEAYRAGTNVVLLCSLAGPLSSVAAHDEILDLDLQSPR